MKWMTLIALSLLSLATSAVRADDLDQQRAVTTAVVTTQSTRQTPLSTLPLQNPAVQFFIHLHVPEFLGTALAFTMMTWALRTRRVV